MVLLIGTKNYFIVTVYLFVPFESARLASEKLQNSLCIGKQRLRDNLFEKHKVKISIDDNQY